MNAVVLLLPLLLAGANTPDESVDAGREALGKTLGGYPWYDSSTDDVRRVEVDKPANRSFSAGTGPPLGLMGILKVMAWIVIIAIFAGVVFLLVRALRKREDRLAATGKNASGPDEGDGARVEALPFPVRAGKSDLLSEARRLYREGNYGQAIVYLFSYQLVQLDKQQVIRLTKGKTNRQYLREVVPPAARDAVPPAARDAVPRAALQGLIEQTMVTFEEAFFGNRTIDRVRFESCWTRLDEFEAMTGETA